MQGDVVAIYNANGERIFEYVYDAWGNILRSKQVATGGNAANSVNPFRYRGYYYDTETGLYYLQSRYYNPEWGRFLNADNATIITDTGTISDKNMFAYCGNNPVMRTDENGEFWNFVIGATVGGLIGGVVAAVTSYQETGSVDILKVAIGVAGGTASGLVAASGLGWIAQAGITAGISGISDIANQTVDIVDNGGSVADYDIFRTMKEAALGGITSAAGSGLGGINRKIYYRYIRTCKSSIRWLSGKDLFGRTEISDRAFFFSVN